MFRKLAVALVAFLGLPGIAPAVTFSGDFSISGSALSDPGLVVQAAPQNGTFSFDLDPGTWTYMTLFNIWTEEEWVNLDDEVPQELSVAFNLTLPTPAGGVLGGSTSGESVFFGLLQWGQVTWSNPLQIALGSGGILSIFLSDATFSEGFLGLGGGHDGQHGKKRHKKKHDKTYGTPIKAKFKYEVSAVPLPAALPMLVAALGLLGWFAGGRRRPAVA